MAAGRTRRLVVLGVLGLALAALALWALGQVLDARERTRMLTGLQDEVRQTRSQAEACGLELGLREAAFRRLDQRVDSLRAEVARFEALDPRGVPQPRYDAYLAQVELYNQSVEAWEARARALREAETACRAAVERHNLLADSLGRTLEAEGLSPQPESTPGGSP